MAYQNHRLKMVIQSKRWMATKIHLDHSYHFRKKWSPLRQVPLGEGETSAKSKSWCTTCLTKEVVLLILLKDVTSLLFEGFDPFNQYRCMIYLSVGGLYR
jgi:hypothetical protein